MQLIRTTIAIVTSLITINCLQIEGFIVRLVDNVAVVHDSAEHVRTLAPRNYGNSDPNPFLGSLERFFRCKKLDRAVVYLK